MIFTEVYRSKDGKKYEQNEIYVSGNDPFLACIELCEEAKDVVSFYYQDDDGSRRVKAFENLGMWYVFDEFSEANDDGWFVKRSANVCKGE